MSIFAKFKNKINVIKNEHMPLVECMSEVEDLIDFENRSHAAFLYTVATMAIEKYGLHIFCLLIANQVRAVCDNFDNTELNTVEEWAYSYDEISELPLTIIGTQVNEFSFIMMKCSKSDLYYLAEICIDKLRECLDE